MTPKKLHSTYMWELLLTALILTSLVVVYEASWFDTSFLPVVHSELKEESSH